MGAEETHPGPQGQSGQPSRDRLAPLWEEPKAPKVGRPVRVRRGEVVLAAVAIADEQGLGKVSMRAVARALGVGTMTLYSHVPGREELIDLMIERAHADLDLPGPDMEWRPALETYARARWAMLRDHTWLLDLNPWRMPLGPHVLASDEAVARCLVDTGLAPAQVVETIDVVNHTIIGAARSAAAEADDQLRQGEDCDAYWSGSTDFWATRFEPERFPTMTRLWTVGAYDAKASPFDLRLDGLLDTIELLIDNARTKGVQPVPGYDECMGLLDARIAEVPPGARQPAEAWSRCGSAAGGGDARGVEVRNVLPGGGPEAVLRAVPRALPDRCGCRRQEGL